MIAVEWALTKFNDNGIYGTLPVPERERMEALITELFSRNSLCGDSLQIFRHTATKIHENNLTVISFADSNISVRKVADFTQYWLLKNKRVEKSLKFPMNTETIVISWKDRLLRATVITLGYGNHHAELAEYYWEKDEPETFIEKESRIPLKLKEYHYPDDKKWDYKWLVTELEKAQLITVQVTNTEDAEDPREIVKISELIGDFRINMNRLGHLPMREDEYILKHLLYLYNTKVAKQ